MGDKMKESKEKHILWTRESGKFSLRGNYEVKIKSRRKNSLDRESHCDFSEMEKT
jgi:hypothetical protein